MPDTYYQYLSIDDRRYAWTIAQDNCGRRAFLLEKDIWVVAVLEVLFESFCGTTRLNNSGASRTHRETSSMSAR